MSVNAACTSRWYFDSKFNGLERYHAEDRRDLDYSYGVSKITTLKPGVGQSERFSDIGAARRGLGAVCCPAEV